MGSFPETYNDPKKLCGEDAWNEGLKRRPDPSALARLRFFFLSLQEFLRWRDRPGGEKSRITFLTHSTSREDFGLYQILKEISPLKLQYCA